MPLSTGMALNAIKDHTTQETVQHSIAYLLNKQREVRTPLSLAWSILGLSTWNACIEPSLPMIDACLKNQNKYGAYDTESLSLLMLAAKSSNGLEGIFSDSVQS